MGELKWVMGCLRCGEVAQFSIDPHPADSCPICGEDMVIGRLDTGGTRYVGATKSKIGYVTLSKRSVRSRKFLRELAEIKAKGASA